MMTRRQAIKTTALAAAATTVSIGFAQTNTPAASAGATPFMLPSLPYALDALEPHIDARTMEIHHGKHHKAYVDNLNKALADYPTLAAKNIEDLLKELNSNAVPEKIRASVRNNGGGHHNHSLFWQMMKKNGGGEAKAELAKAIEKSFGDFAAFKTAFAESAMKVFGSGWAWLVIAENGLKIVSMPNQNSPISPDVIPTEVHDSSGKKMTFIQPSQQPVLGLDVWEHAYYLKYQNKRADYIAAWWNVVDWDFAAERYAALR